MRISFATHACLLTIFLSQPAFCQFVHVFNIPPDSAPQPVEKNTQINLFDMGELPNDFVAGILGDFDINIEINVFGGQVGANAELLGGVSLNVFGGEIGKGFNNWLGARAFFFGGSVADGFAIRYELIEDGVFGDHGDLIGVGSGKTSRITGGQFGIDLRLWNCEISGGKFGDDLVIEGSRKIIFDGQFGSVEVRGLDCQIFGGEFDGPITVSGWAAIAGGNIASIQVPGNLEMLNGTVAGDVEIGFKGCFSGGTVAGAMTTLPSSLLIISDGNFGTVDVAGIANISGGVFSNDVCLGSSGRLVVSGGGFEAGFMGKTNAETLIAGGLFDGVLSFESEAHLRLMGTEFRLLDLKTGELIEDLTPILNSLEPGEAYQIEERDVVLEGLLNDGSPFRIELNSIPQKGQDFADETARILIARDFPIPFLVPATEVIVFRGIPLTPNEDLVFNCAFSDDIYARVSKGFVLNVNELPIWLVFTGTVPEEFLETSILFAIESQALTPGLTAMIEAFNTNTQQYDVLSFFDASHNLDVVRAVPFSSEYIDQDTLEVKARVGWQKTGLIINFPWEVHVDHVYWGLNMP